MSNPTTNQIKNKSSVSGNTVTEALNALLLVQGDGTGDMLKIIYDNNNNGKVDVAEVAEAVPWTGVTSKPSTFPPQTHNHAISDVTSLQSTLDGKQATLVSGTNIKTINGTSVLGSGDLTVSGGGSTTVEDILTSISTINALSANQGRVLKNLTDGKEPSLPSGGTTAQYLRGDKTLRDFATDVRAAVITGLSTATNAAIDATDTVLAALGKLQAQISGYAAATLTFTNKRINPRVTSETSSATPTINTDNTDIHRVTALAANVTSFTTNLSGTPVHGQGLLVEITGTAARTLSWGASFEAGTIALPTTTVSTNMLTVAFVWNSGTSKWRCVGVV